MKKHIIVSGVPRSGKSTVSQQISDQLGYQHISMDSIIAGIEKAFPETGIDSEADTDLWENIRYISSRMAIFIRGMIDSGEYNECDYGMVIDIFQLLPQHYVQYLSESDSRIIYLGTSEVTYEERYDLLKKYDTPKDYTYYKSDKENRKDCAAIVEISKRIKEECSLYDLRYYDTSYDRDQVFKAVLNDITE